MAEIASAVLVALQWALLIATMLLSLAALFLLVQVGAALKSPLPPARPPRRPRIAILIPAHNEATGIRPTLLQAKAQLQIGDRLLVVADNCSDETAQIARAAGAEVCERENALLRGKGYALDHGIRALQGDPPDVVVVIDADCSLTDDAISHVASWSHMTGRPAQARYLMRAPGAKLSSRMAEFAMRLKNWVRPRGMARMSMPCGLYGSGMAFPWAVVERVPFASGHIAEDVQLGLRSCEVGAPPMFCEMAEVSSVFPDNAEGDRSQRRRWEHGHLKLLLSVGPRMVAAGLLRRRWSQLVMACDLMIPPLALLMIGLAVAAAIGIVVALLGAGIAIVTTAMLGLIALALAVLLTWANFARDIIGVGELAILPILLLRKISIYAAFLFHRQVDWIRTKRDT